jgi:hypothetical protein
VGHTDGAGELAERRRQDQRAMLGVSPAAAGLVEMRDVGWMRMMASVKDQRVDGGQAEAAADECNRQQEGIHAGSQAPAHDRV